MNRLPLWIPTKGALIIKSSARLLNRMIARLKLLRELALVSTFCLSLQAEQRPNILIFLVDDMGPMDTSVPFLSEGGQPKTYPLNERYRTPAMEQLAKQGLRFERYYANSVCSPSRVSLITGQNAARHQTTQWINPYGRNMDPHAPKDWNWQGVAEGSITLPGLLADAGYHTIHVGKAHWGPLDHPGADPVRIGFDRNVAGSAWGRPGSYYGTRNFTNAKQLRQPPHLNAYHGQDIHLTEALTNEMLKQLDIGHATGKPIFAHMAFYSVHSPFEADPKFLKNYPKDLPGRAFAAMIEGMDHAVGRILAHLQTLGIAENTLVFFLGDNGSVHSSKPLRGIKAQRYEGGTRVPFIVSWAKPSDNELQAQWQIPEGEHHTESFGTILDLMPTILNLTGTAAPQCYIMDGHDLRDVHAGETPQTFLMHFPHQHRSAYFTTWHHGDWKLIYQYHWQPRLQLFNLADDPEERDDRTTQEPERLRSMFQEMTAALQETNAQFPTAKKTGEPLRPQLN